MGVGWSVQDVFLLILSSDVYSNSVVHSFVHLFLHFFIHSFIHSFVHSFIHSFIHSLIHLFIHSCVQSIPSYSKTSAQIGLLGLVLLIFIAVGFSHVSNSR